MSRKKRIVRRTANLKIIKKPKNHYKKRPKRGAVTGESSA